ncbi:MAG: hypothetical protein WC819_03035 [Parcubacteria group bacterium]|jgi:hypothetical protein
MVIGFSCGVFYRLQNNSHERFSKELVDRFCATGARAIELMCHTEEHVKFLSAGEHAHIMQFDHISIHAPVIAYDDDAVSHVLLKQLEELSARFSATYVVFHPDAVKRWDIISQYKIPVAIENMDDRKKSFRTLDDVQSLLDRYPFGLVIDLQHCFVNDPSMQLAKELHAQFGDRIVGYHISGYGPELLHVPLFETCQNEIVGALKQKERPIIIESTFSAYGDEKMEMQYITSQL